MGLGLCVCVPITHPYLSSLFLHPPTPPSFSPLSLSPSSQHVTLQLASCQLCELCALHVSSVALLDHSVQLQLLLLRMSECGLRSTVTTEQWCSYGECKSASVWNVCGNTHTEMHVHTHMHTFTHAYRQWHLSWLTVPLL